jgi:mono/diheme cytochrome c family protein
MAVQADEGEEMPAGQELFLAQRCNLCHSVPPAGIEATTKSDKMKGPELVDLDLEPEWMGQFLRKQVQKDGADHKKEFKGTDEELQTLISWLLEQKSEG